MDWTSSTVYDDFKMDCGTSSGIEEHDLEYQN